MSLRSTTGCSTCKTKRKKCDETKPKCLRCTEKGLECQYEYIEPRSSRSTKSRTKPAPRPPSERAKALAKQQLRSRTIREFVDFTETLEKSTGSSNHPRVSSPEITLPLDVDWEALLYESVTAPTLDPFTTSGTSSRSLASQHPAPLGLLTSGQSSLDALFSLEATDPGQSYTLLNPSGLISDSLLELASDSRPSDKGEDEEEIEGFKASFCEARLVLDRRVDSNSMVFVLHSYAQFMPLSIFDPVKAGHRTKQTVIGRYLASPISRSRVVLISEVARRLAQSPNLDEGGKKMLLSLRSQIWQNVSNYQVGEWPLSKEERERARAALVHMVELVNMSTVAPLAYTLRILQLAAPVFLCSFPPPYPPHLPDILLTIRDDIILEHFAVSDVVTSIMTGRPLLCQYYVPWSLELCDEFMKNENSGLRWLFGIPDQFVLLFAYMDGLMKEVKAAGKVVDPNTIKRLEGDISKINISPCKSRDPSLTIARLVVQECWRQAVFIYLYMALCGADAFDPRVQKVQKGFLKLMDGTKPSRNPDVFLIPPMVIAGVATTKSTHQQIIQSRILFMPEFEEANTSGNDSLRILKDIWARTKSEGRPARWQDLREACQRVTGV
ncbi:hypothetical protein RSOLAG1IB_09987 [Rhizoctonia solani AG-1 IB]|uniref:Zn(2)-C6 fungal-type domain-containing protein n=1 Tax=Thanatephorus cucumeris (strain AG1-IB / isolate 7/3/14) TaxID=1108050 RepID=A0A0B7FWX4_THACB|nr:hypothetical protein RSOLAG1IB_09987 [Rhizoctonia solani AG-1 IB]